LTRQHKFIRQDKGSKKIKTQINEETRKGRKKRNIEKIFEILTPWCRILFEKLTVTELVKQYPAFFMEPEGSFPCSQNPATGPYPEPAESSSPH
jgi:hypothetical protein